MTGGYYRSPTIHGETIVFVSEDDLWMVPVSGGLARRLTSNLGEITSPRLSPDGTLLAFAGCEEGYPEVYVMPAEGGRARRLTYLSGDCQIVGWNPQGTAIIFASTSGHWDDYLLFQIAADALNGTAETLPYGPARSIAFGPDEQIVIGRGMGDPARWKRYRGGTAGHLWIGREGEFEPFLSDVRGNIAAPMWIWQSQPPSNGDKAKSNEPNDRIFFMSDHEGIGNLYSCRPNGTNLVRHTDHNDYYARNPSSDGQRIVYHAGADIYVYDVAQDSVQKVEVDYRSPRVQRNRKFVSSAGYLNGANLHPSGQVISVVSRGRAFTMPNHDGPVFQHGQRDGVRYRLPEWFNDGRRLLLISDETGEETLEIHVTELGIAPVRLTGLDIGRPIALKMSPTQDKIAVANHRYELLIVDLTGLDPEEGTNLGTDVADDEGLNKRSDNGESEREKEGHHREGNETKGDLDKDSMLSRLTMVDRSSHRQIAGFDWSPDGRWLTYGFGQSTHTTAIRLYRLPDPDAEDETLHTDSIHTITRPILHDLNPSFDPDGKYIYFLSRREFNPVRDALHFDWGFPWGMRPYLVTLQTQLSNPFIPRPDFDDEDEESDTNSEDEEKDESENENGEENQESEISEDDNSVEVVEASEPDGPNIAGEQTDIQEADVGQNPLIDEKQIDADTAALHLFDEEQADKSEESKQPTSEQSNPLEQKEAKKKKANSWPVLRIDLENIEQRVLAFPVPDARYAQIEGISGKVYFTSYPIQGVLDEGDSWDDDDASRVLRVYDFKEYKSEVVADDVWEFGISRNRKKMLYSRGRQLRVINAGDKPPSDSGHPRKTGWIELNRIKISVDPPKEWQQMLREAWRLQRDHFWTEDMSQIDWVAIYQRYEPLVDRISTRSEFSDIVWEMQGELGTSHAYERGGDYRHSPYYLQGLLGTSFTWDADAGGYVVGEFIVGDSWDQSATSPLAAPGVDVRPGDVLVAINGQMLDAQTGPASLLVNQAGNEVLLSFLTRPEDTAATTEDVSNNDGSTPKSDPLEDSGKEFEQATKEQTSKGNIADNESVKNSKTTQTEKGGQQNHQHSRYRNVTVKTLYSEQRALYRAWVEQNRQRVHEATDEKVGYVHVPDMGPRGYAEFHRGFLAETDREGLIVDVRYNGGGSVSQLILEKLARRRIGFDLARWGGVIPYPEDSVAGPMVALTNELAGSDGDVFCHAFKLMKLGPLIGKRTWGGVIGITYNQMLVDGTITTQPEYSFWVKDVGWALENYGTDPDIEVDIAPQDYTAGRDPQLDRAIKEVLRLLAETAILKPDLENRPQRPLPKLPPRTS
ncbi:PDZ domain-containing protein [Chloroflexi bacterium TSY]|nr:PDZ domain-containing protein [Chloroflexi bacterium TSY]